MYQEEVGESGTHHLQGYIECGKACRRSKFTGLEGAAFFVPKGSREECKDYCKKEDTRVGGPYEFGEWMAGGQGGRTDVLALRDAIKLQRGDRELFDDDLVAPAAIRYCRSIDRMRTAYQPQVPRDGLVVTFHYGPSGTGKTFCAHSDAAYYFDGNNGFFEGYQGQETIILDEFGGHTLSPLMFQRLCDRYPFTLNVKGGSTPCRAVNIEICSNYLPSQWWGEKTRYNQEAVYRRIHVVHWHDKYKHFVIFKSDEGGYAMEKLVHALTAPKPINVII